MAYEDYCAACTYLSESVNCGKYWCSVKGKDVYANDPKCYNFCEAYSRSNYGRENMYNNSANSGSGCYLTTIMCQLLNYPDNNYYLNTLRNFRDNVMKKDPKYISLLLTYDIIGPMISYELAHDINGPLVAKAFFNQYIIKSVDAIIENKNEEAISIYKDMTNQLGEHYHINTNVIDVDITKVNMNTLGHGKVRKLPIK